MTDAPNASRTSGPALLLLGLFVVVGAALRLIVAHESLFADELSTFWIATDHGLGGVVSTVHTTAEITPPLYFVMARITTTLGHAPELVRLPSLIAGIATIVLVHRLGRRTVGAAPALVAAGFFALAPFAIYYSTEARAYGVMMAFTVGSSLALLTAIDTGRRRWWAVYAVCSAGAMYSHYTCAFLLAAQALWALVAHPEARRAVLVANVAAAGLFAPWITGLKADLDSPTTAILDQLSPFTWTQVSRAFERWSIGYPGAVPATLGEFPGFLALALLAVACLLGLTGAVARWRGLSAWELLRSRATFVVILALSLPVAETVASAVGTNLLGTRNLAASYPALVLALAALVMAAPGRLRVVAVGLAGLFLVIGAVKMPTDQYRRPDVRGAVRLVEREADPGAVVIDETGVLSPGPLTSVDSLIGGGYHVLRAATPETREHPFTVYDRIIPISEAIRRAVTLARGGKVWVIGYTGPSRTIPSQGVRQRRAALAGEIFPPPYRLVERHEYPGVLGTVVRVYARG